MEKRLLYLSVILPFLIIFSLFFISGWQSSQPVIIYTEGINCNSTENFAEWINATFWQNNILIFFPISVVFNSSGNVGNCSLYNKTCCPIDYRCNNRTGMCEKILSNYCENILTREKCEDVGNRTYFGNLTFFELKLSGWELCGVDLPDGQLCTNYTTCECYWVSSTNKCSVRMNKNRTCESVPGGGITISQEKCEYILESKEDKCADLGKIIIKYKAIKTPSNANIPCQDSTREYPCSSVVSLPFFSFSGFIVSLLIIAILYLFFRK
ncbi:MAG: hypothetical protein QXX68_03145 [Candidatus Pacearchaeota archaeon]